MDGLSCCQNIFDAANKRHIKCIAACTDVNAKTNIGWTSLMVAATYGHVDCVEMLIKAGADVNAKSDTGKTSLMFAAEEGHVECVETLIIAGADVNAKNNNGRTSLMIASEKGYIECIEILEMYSEINAAERIEKIKNYRLMKELKSRLESIDINDLELDFDGIKRKLNDDEKDLITCIISQSFTLDPVRIVAPGVTDKHVYDRHNIDAWIKKHKISPITKQVCTGYILQSVEKAASIIEKIKIAFS